MFTGNSFMVASVAVVPDDMPMATSILTFTQTLMSSVSLPVARSVFHDQLSTNLRSLLPAAGTALLVQSGATGFRKHLTSSQLPVALLAYNKAISQTFYVLVATASLPIFGPMFMEWFSSKSGDKADDIGNAAKARLSEAEQNIFEVFFLGQFHPVSLNTHFIGSYIPKSN